MPDIRLDWDPCEQCDVETILVKGPDLDEPATCAGCGRERGTLRDLAARQADTIAELVQEGVLDSLGRSP